MPLCAEMARWVLKYAHCFIHDRRIWSVSIGEISAYSYEARKVTGRQAARPVRRMAGLYLRSFKGPVFTRSL